MNYSIFLTRNKYITACVLIWNKSSLYLKKVNYVCKNRVLVIFMTRPLNVRKYVFSFYFLDKYQYFELNILINLWVVFCFDYQIMIDD